MDFDKIADSEIRCRTQESCPSSTGDLHEGQGSIQPLEQQMSISLF